MKKKILLITVLILAALMLTACSSRKETSSGEVVVVPPSTQTVEVVPTVMPTVEPTPMPTPEPTPEPTPVPTPQPTPVPAPVVSNLPRITKDPASEKVAVNGKCQFVTRYENADLAEWHFISPDGSWDLNYVQAQNQFPTLKIINGFTKDLTLDNIPAELNGWRVYCRFSNNYGSVNTNTATITVDGTQVVPTPYVQNVSYEGRWAGESASRCQLTMTYRAAGSVNVEIFWSNSANERYCWAMTGNLSADGSMVYNDGHAWLQTYIDENSYRISEESFGGYGYFYIRDGKLHWVDSSLGRETVFIRA